MKLKQKLTFCVLLFVGFVSAKGQSVNELNGMINNTYSLCIEYHKKFYDKEANEKTLPFNKTINIIINHWPSNFRLSKAILDGDYNYINICKLKVKRKCDAILFDGILLDKDTIKIKLITYSLYMKRGVFHYDLSDWFYGIYQYCCETKKWQFVGVKTGGV